MREAHLRDFIAAVEAGSVRGAARRLGITQAAVSKNLSALERSFGVPLLLRSAHGVEPTDFGRVLLRRARIVDAELRKLDEEFKTLAGDRQGTISIGVSATVEAVLLSRALSRFHQQSPEVQVSILGGRSPTTIAALREGQLDFVIGPPAPGLLSPDLQSERLFSAELTIVMRAGHPLAACTDLAELGACQWIYGVRQQPPFPALSAVFHERGLPVPPLVAQCDSFSAMLYLLLQTDMVAAVSLPTVQPFRDQGLLTTPPVDVRFPPLVQHLITSSTRPLTASASALAAEFRKASRRYRR